MQLFPGALSGIVSGEHLQLSFLEMEEGSEVPAHSHPHEQAGIVLREVAVQDWFGGIPHGSRGCFHCSP